MQYYFAYGSNLHHAQMKRRCPKCRSTMPLAEDGKTPLPKAVPEVTGYNCDKCNKPMVIKDSRRGKFLGCSGFPKCRNTKPLPDSSSKLISVT